MGRESCDKLPLGNSFKEQVEYIGLAYLDGPNYSHGGNVTDCLFFFRKLRYEHDVIGTPRAKAVYQPSCGGIPYTPNSISGLLLKNTVISLIILFHLIPPYLQCIY